ncbi:hypothetical protein R1flu_016842 [Riccia fluitans]|uniref:Uncharacterized protein n=1 Tax=Riccia fluitans TaxID=41844 RepID=A0ABD1YN02_9MARC
MEILFRAKDLKGIVDGSKTLVAAADEAEWTKQNTIAHEQTLEKLQTRLLKEELILRSRQESDEVYSQALFSRKSKPGGHGNGQREDRKAGIREMKRTTNCYIAGNKDIGHCGGDQRDAWFLDGGASEHMMN